MNTNDVEKEMLRRIKLTRDSILTKVVNKTTKDAQTNFNNFEVHATTDNPRVSVSHTTITTGLDKSTSEVRCFGEQVIFLEFGVGVNNSMEKNVRMFTVQRGSSVGLIGLVSYGGKSGNKGAYGFEEGGWEETAERPAGVVPLGRYGKGQGSEDYWIRPSSFGIPNEVAGESHVYKKNGEARTDVVWTVGHNPSRALYRAYTGAVRYVLSEVVRKSKTKTPRYQQLSLFD